MVLMAELGFNNDRTEIKITTAVASKIFLKEVYGQDMQTGWNY